jgi:hypothetical protein
MAVSGRRIETAAATPTANCSWPHRPPHSFHLFLSALPNPLHHFGGSLWPPLEVLKNSGGVFNCAFGQNVNQGMKIGTVHSRIIGLFRRKPASVLNNITSNAGHTNCP